MVWGSDGFFGDGKGIALADGAAVQAGDLRGPEQGAALGGILRQLADSGRGEA